MSLLLRALSHSRLSLLIFAVLAFKGLFVTGAVQRTLEEARQERQRLVQKYIKTLNKEEGAIRLVGGETEYEGNIEVLHNNKWGAICDDEWDALEGRVVCRQLGYPGLKRVTHDGYFGLARRRFWMDNMYCEGNEHELTDCHFEGWGTNDCEANEAAGVVCDSPDTERVTEAPLPPLLPKFTLPHAYRMDLRLRGGRRANEGRVEVRIDSGRWGTICSDGWSLLEANVVCRQLSLGFARDALQTDYFGGLDIAPAILSGTACYGNESTLAQCLHHDHLRPPAECHGERNHVAVVACDHLAPDLVVDFFELERTAHLEDRPLALMQCAMEENCVANEAYDIQRDDPNWRYVTRRLLKFTASTLNAGNTDFRPFKEKHLWEWHMCHMHYHSMEVFATFDVYDLLGSKVAQGHKASFCLEDNQCLSGVPKKYNCANFGNQGISVNCSDIYLYNLDCQWVDISELDTGSYILKISVNPEFKVAEMSFDNNAAVCNLLYTDTYARVDGCRLARP
ncbi:PREDICTED: lysyl oxidase homolog 2B [Bactrocera latifrons]|uniref:lysyl oxidase homolog 2B n=1 Tax=Bactrocera latifrons TaxID=174628 RepID=UPI0008DEA102|nr:PREDICTED: lysyl oxidase homolog 2B [Bactrocera latifrons]